MKKLIIIGLAVLMLLPALLASGCNDKKEGELPVLKTGDKWVTTVVLGGNEYTMTQEVTGEEVRNEKDCYVMESIFDPPVDGYFDSRTVWYEKTTMLPVEKQMSYVLDGESTTVITVYTYEWPDAQPYPLEVGKEYKTIETASTTTSYITSDTMGVDVAKNTYIYKVEKTEDITVPAGKFKCFKIVQYDETGTTVLKTTWQSDKTGQYIVKETDQYGEIIRELQSYSLK